MIILGIDPGLAIVGWGVVDYRAGKFKTLGYGAIRTPAGIRTEERLAGIYRDLTAIIQHFHPEEMAVEELFFNTNITTGIAVAHGRGVILCAAEKCGVPLYEYTPSQVKLAVTGYGKAEKRQVMDMTKRLLKLAAVPKPDDAADALALALCHARSFTSRLPQSGAVRETI